MTSTQVRAARALVHWTVRDLASKSGIHRNTITNIETGRYAGEAETITAIRTALEAAGVEFLGEDGVRLRERS